MRKMLVIALLVVAFPLPSAQAIVNQDRPVYNNEALWTARITLDNPYTTGKAMHCSGVLIAPDKVLTASHCVDPDMGADILSTLMIELGVHHVSDPNKIIRYPKSIIYHNKYFRTQSYTLISEDQTETLVKGKLYKGEKEQDSDIALIILNKPVNSIKPIKLPHKNYIPEGELRTYGWGLTEKAETTELLTAKQVDYTNEPKTQELYNSYYKNDYSKVIAAIAYNEQELVVGTCYGDSGGPLVDQTNTLIGLTSWADTYECEDKVPTIFTKVSEFLTWIKSAEQKAAIVGKSNICKEQISKNRVENAKLEAEKFARELNALAAFEQNGNAQIIAKNHFSNDIFEKGVLTTSNGAKIRIKFENGVASVGKIAELPKSKYKSLIITGFEFKVNTGRKGSKTTAIKPKNYQPDTCTEIVKNKTYPIIISEVQIIPVPIESMDNTDPVRVPVTEANQYDLSSIEKLIEKVPSGLQVSTLEDIEILNEFLITSNRHLDIYIDIKLEKFKNEIFSPWLNKVI